jgi:hypothetical protein
MDNAMALGSKKEPQMIWLTDAKGNYYLVRKDAVEANLVSAELKAELDSVLEAETQGYGSAQYLLDGISKLWGAKLGDKIYDVNFDLDNDGVIGSGDWDIAKKAYYEQNPPPDPRVPPYVNPGK